MEYCTSKTNVTGWGIVIQVLYILGWGVGVCVGGGTIFVLSYVLGILHLQIHYLASKTEAGCNDALVCVCGRCSFGGGGGGGIRHAPPCQNFIHP